MYRKTTLPNGLRVMTVPVPHVRSVSISVFLGAGSRYESDDVAGISHFLEHMSFKGTHKRPQSQEISECIERVGGFMNAATDREVTVYWAKVAAPYFLITLDLLMDMLLNSLHDAEEMEKERRVILEELASVNDSPQQKVELLIDETVWPGQPLGRDVAGTRESVLGITRQMTLDYKAAQYTPSNAVVAIAGAVEHDEVVEAVEKEVAGWSARDPTAMDTLVKRSGDSRGSYGESKDGAVTLLPGSPRPLQPPPGPLSLGPSQRRSRRGHEQPALSGAS